MNYLYIFALMNRVRYILSICTDEPGGMNSVYICTDEPGGMISEYICTNEPGEMISVYIFALMNRVR